MLTIIIKTKNSEFFLCNTLEAVKDCELIILDEHSTDDTVEIAREYKAKIIFYDALEFSSAFNQALSESSNDWVLVLEDNEIIPDKLLSKIYQYIEKPKKNCNTLTLPVKTIYLDKEIKSARKKQLKLFKKGFVELKNNFSYDFKPLKSKIFKMNKNFKDKNCYVLKFVNENIIDRFKNNLEKITLDLKVDETKKISLFFKPLRKFLYLYFIKGAVYEGKRGFIYAIYATINDFIINCAKFEREKRKSE